MEIEDEGEREGLGEVGVGGEIREGQREEEEGNSGSGVKVGGRGREERGRTTMISLYSLRTYSYCI